MALIYPFQGYRYNKAAVEDLNLVVTQPFDKITHSLQQEYYRRSPSNVVRITRNLEKNENPATTYAEAGSTFRHWIDQGLLVQDPQPAIYAYYQEYNIEGERKLQRGFVALLDLKHSASNIIPHERTLAEPKTDRLQLMRSIEGNDDVIYMLYADKKLTVNGILDESVVGRQPEIEVKDDDGAMHRIWTITEPETLKKIQEAMIPKELFIADGHHRFETSLNFMKECEERNWRPANVESFDKRMVTCFNSADEGVTILPTHRLLRDLAAFDPQGFLKRVEQYFDVETVSSREGLWQRMKQSREEHVFGFYPAGLRRYFLLRLKPAGMADPLMLKHVEAYRHLDVSILHSLILERYLGIDEKKLVAQAHIDYARERDSCLQQVDEGKYQAVFFLNSTTAEQMQRVALLGERMPQKSTDFYPKLLTGLIFMKMKIIKE